MRTGRPTVHLLAGLPGSGKTTFARKLEAQGVVRISVDEEMVARHGQIGVGHPVGDHVRLLRPVLEWATDRIAAEVGAGNSVVLDHGLGNRRDRDTFKRIAEHAGAEWRLMSFRVDLDTLLERLAARSGEGGTASMPITPEMLAYLASVYEEPSGEGEALVE